MITQVYYQPSINQKSIAYTSPIIFFSQGVSYVPEYIPKYITDEKKSMNLAKLLSFRALDKNWNGNGADPFTDKLLQKASEAIVKLSSVWQPSIFPTGRDSVQFEFFNGEDGGYLEIELYEDMLGIFYKYPNGDTGEYETTFSIDEIHKAVSDFYGFNK